MNEIKQLTAEHFEAMMRVGSGATVWNYGIATLLREVERFNKDFIEILSVKELKEIDEEVSNLSGADEFPKFGAVITKKGFEFLEKEGKEIFLAEKTK